MQAKLIATVFITGFILNMIWENTQAPLYEGYAGFREHFMICFWASLVDALVTLFLFGLISVWKKNVDWIRKLSSKEVAVLVLAGGAITVTFEHWAFQYGIWDYNEKMPVVPFINVGLAPLLQMMVLPPLTFYITGMFFKAKQPKVFAK